MPLSGWPPKSKDILAFTDRVAAAREAKLDEAILALSAQVKLDDDYKAIYDAFKARMDPKNLPRDHPAQVAAAQPLPGTRNANLVLYM